MTHLEQFKQMLNSAAIEYKITDEEGITKGVVVQNKSYGYRDFYSVWFFNEQGQLVDVGHWE